MARKELTPEQRAAKNARDRDRRAEKKAAKVADGLRAAGYVPPPTASEPASTSTKPKPAAAAAGGVAGSRTRKPTKRQARKTSRKTKRKSSRKRRATRTNWGDVIDKLNRTASGTIRRVCSTPQVAQVTRVRLLDTFSGIHAETKGNTLTISRA